MQRLITALVAVSGLAALPVQAAAQIDYRNLDDERPVQTEDAYTIERYAFEFMLPFTLQRAQGGGGSWVLAPEFAYGLLNNLQVGVKTPLAALDGQPGTRWGFADPRVFALYNFNTESRVLPAFMLRGDLAIPVRGIGGETTRLTLKGVATHSWGLTRAHLNVSRTFGSENGIGSVETTSRWAYSAAVDRTFYRQSLLLIGEVAGSQSVRNAPTELNASLGIRYQWTPTIVLDAGLTRRLRASQGPDAGLTIGFTHAFAVSALMPKRASMPETN